jgi:spore coat polysaccharide biosynthesis protein SpsF
MIGVVLQCRSQSKRLPRKIYADLGGGKYTIQRILEGMKKTVVPHKIILAMPKEDKDEIEQRIKSGELDPYIDDRFELFIASGAQDDLVDRYHKVARKYDLDVIARITGDCPGWIGASKIMDEMLMEYLALGTNGFLGNNLLIARAPYPCGIDCEIFSYEMMCWAKMHATTAYDLEHCTPIMYSDISPFKIHPFDNCRPHTMITNKISDFSLDTTKDYQMLLKIMESFDKDQNLNKALENVDIGEFDKTNFSKNLRQ